MEFKEGKGKSVCKVATLSFFLNICAMFTNGRNFSLTFNISSYKHVWAWKGNGACVQVEGYAIILHSLTSSCL